MTEAVDEKKTVVSVRRKSRAGAWLLLGLAAGIALSIVWAFNQEPPHKKAAAPHGPSHFTQSTVAPVDAQPASPVCTLRCDDATQENINQYIPDNTDLKHFRFNDPSRPSSGGNPCRPTIRFTGPEIPNLTVFENGVYIFDLTQTQFGPKVCHNDCVCN